MEANNNNKGEWQKRELGAFWKRTSQSGQTYLSGHVEVDELGTKKKIKCVMFSNKDKSNERAPDYRVYVSKDKNSENDGGGQPTNTTEQNQVVDEQVL